MQGKKPVNLFQAAKHDMPAGAGCKGGKPNRVRRRKSQPITKIVSMSQEINVETAATASPGTTTPRSRASTLVEGQSSTMSPAITEMSTPDHAWKPLMLTSATTNPTPICTWNPDIAMFPEPTAPFHLAFITGNISICQGCKHKFPRNSDGTIVDPPYNIVIRHDEARTFQNPSTGMMQTKKGNAYYHVYLNCVRSKWPNFDGKDVEIDQVIKSKLMQSHKELIYYNLGLFLP